MNRRKREIFIIGLLSLFLSLLPSRLSWFKSFEAYTWDWRINVLADPAKASDEVVVILLDQASLDWVKNESEQEWPWPREYYSYIVDYCRQAGAKAIGFDVLFPDGSSFEDLDDKTFAQSISNFKHFVIAASAGNNEDDSSELFDTYKNLHLSQVRSRQLGAKAYTGLNIPHPPLAKSASLLAHVNASPDIDNTNRKSRLFVQVGNNNIPSLGLGVYLAANRDSKISFDSTNVTVGETKIPVDKEGLALLRFRGPSTTHKTFTAREILQSYLFSLEDKEPAVSQQELKGKYVFFGYSAPGLHDQHNVPVGDKYPGVEVHATFLDNLLTNSFFKELSPAAGYGIALILALIATTIILNSSSYIKQGIFVIILLTFPSFIAFGAASFGYKIDLLLPSVSVASALFLSVGFNYLTEGRQKRFIKHAFNHYLSPHVINEMITNPDKLKLGGERAEISIFFSDLQGFTSISEKLSPEVLIELLNEYLSAMSEIILEEQGTIDKYEGDAIIAFWNAPLPVENHARQIVKSALRCQQVLAEMNPRLKEKAGTDLKMRIGIHTGPAVVGNMGASERFDYTMLGDSVNLAARLEGVNKQFGTFTMISEETRKQMGDTYPVRELAKVEVVGRKEPVRVFEPMLEDEYKQRETYLKKFDEGLQLFYAEKFSEAEKVFESNAENDPPSKFYAAKCRNLLENNLKAPEGVWVMTSK